MESDPKQLTQLLRERFGFEDFRPGQLTAIQTLLEHHALLCIHPTGFGKSLLYQLPSLLLPGMTVVISPLLALMRDQLDHLNHRFGIPAASFNSDQSEEENALMRAKVKEGNVKVLFVAPEQLDNIDRFQYLLGLPISMVVVDEAHCISTWGHDFRPSYRQIVQFTKALQYKEPNLYILGLTATANKRTEEDIRTQLGGTHALQVLRESMDRPNIALSSYTSSGAWEKLATCLELVKKMKGSGLIYCATRDNTNIVADFLSENGVDAVAYHAGLRPEEKRRLQKAFVDDEYRVLTATNALGMGIDKPNIRFIVHFDIPGSITAYYQEVGRSGRDGNPAEGVLLFDPADRGVQEHFIESAQPTKKEFYQLLHLITNEPIPPRRTQIKCLSGLHPTKVNVLIAELVEQEFLEKKSVGGYQVYCPTGKEGAIDLERYEVQNAVRTKELDAMMDYAQQGHGCRMEFLRLSLGDSQTSRCGKCCVCNPAQAAPQPSMDIVNKAQQWLKARIVTIPEAKIVKMSAGVALLDGRVRSPMFCSFMRQRAKTCHEQLGVCDELTALLKKELLKVHAQENIVAIVPVPSKTWGARDAVASLAAEQLGAEYYDDMLQWHTVPEKRQGELKNNDQRRQNVHEKMTAQPKALPPGAILLFDDYIGSGATLKEAARALRRDAKFQGPIIPFTMAQVQWRLGKAGMI